MRLITDIHEIDRAQWLDLLDASPFASPFQLPEVFDLYQEVSGVAADVLAVEDDGELKALMVLTIHYELGVKAYFSRRGIVYGGPLLRSVDDHAALRFLLSYMAERYQKRLIYLEIRNGFDYAPLREDFLQSSFSYVPWLNFQFHSQSPENFKHGMSKSRLRQLNKGLKNGVVWRLAQSTEEVKTFYHILSDLYQHKIRKPLPSLDFFLHYYHSNFAKIIVVEKDEVIIGGVVCPYLEKGYLYEYYICGLDREYPQCYPSTVAMWAMVSLAEELGVQHLDLMGAGEPDKANGVREYKRQFGGELVEHGRYLMVLKPMLYRLGRFVIMHWKRIKNYL